MGGHWSPRLSRSVEAGGEENRCLGACVPGQILPRKDVAQAASLRAFPR